MSPPRVKRVKLALDQLSPQAFQHDERLLELLSQAKLGCEQSLGELLFEYRPFLLQVANQRLPTRLQRKLGGSDIVQQSYLNASCAFDQFKGDTIEELTAWLIRIVVNHALSARRHFNADKRQANKEVSIYHDGVSNDQSSGFHADVPVDESSPSRRMISEERKQLIVRALSSLSEVHRLVLELRSQDGLSYEEIGQILQRSPDATRKLWARAAESLAKVLRSLDESR